MPVTTDAASMAGDPVFKRKVLGSNPGTDASFGSPVPSPAARAYWGGRTLTQKLCEKVTPAGLSSDTSLPAGCCTMLLAIRLPVCPVSYAMRISLLTLPHSVLKAMVAYFRPPPAVPLVFPQNTTPFLPLRAMLLTTVMLE